MAEEKLPTRAQDFRVVQPIGLESAAGGLRAGTRLHDRPPVRLALWENIQGAARPRFKATASERRVPAAHPKSFIEKEKHHVEGFSRNWRSSRLAAAKNWPNRSSSVRLLKPS